MRPGLGMVELTSGQLAAGGVPADWPERVVDSPMVFLVAAAVCGLIAGGVGLLLTRRRPKVRGIDAHHVYRAPRRGGR